MEDNSVIGADTASSGQSSIDIAMVFWGIVALITAVLICIDSNALMVLSAGFFAKALAVLVGTVLGLIGAWIGNAIRKFAAPDAVITSGGFLQLLWIKIFWKIGPQLIGAVFGAAAGVVLVLR